MSTSETPPSVTDAADMEQLLADLIGLLETQMTRVEQEQYDDFISGCDHVNHASCNGILNGFIEGVRPLPSQTQVGDSWFDMMGCDPIHTRNDLRHERRTIAVHDTHVMQIS